MSKDNLKFWQPNDATINYDVEGLVGTKLTVIRQDGSTVQAVVAGVDPYIGVSLVRVDDKERIINCFHGPFDPNYREKYLKRKDWQAEYHIHFSIFVEHIRSAKKTGYLNRRNMFDDVDNNIGRQVYAKSGGVCPFGV
jgi:hypothetical protein